MIRALHTAATGLEAQQSNIERISNDIANVNTDGYKRGRVEFQDLLYETVREPGAQLGDQTNSPVGVQNGMGVKVGAVHKIHEPGPARMTYNSYDFMIEGDGFFQVQLPNGEIRYTRQGAFKRDNTGVLRLSQGATLVPQITVPINASRITVTNSGQVIASLPGEGEAALGQIQLHRFVNQEGLMSEGNGLYRQTVASGDPQEGIPGEDGIGLIQQGALEGSNVNIANSMVDMIQTQRAYELQTRVMSTADKMLGSTVELKR